MSTKIFAHRGASMYAPENTLPALELANELEADGVEIDVRLTKDLIPILIHDDTIDRTTDGKGLVKEYTFKELQSFDAGSWFSEKYVGTKIISLEGFLQWATKNTLLLNIELKVDETHHENFEEIVYDLVEEYSLLDRTIISTFSEKSLERIKSLKLPFNRALLTSKDKGNLRELTKDFDLNGLHIQYGMLSETFMEQARKDQVEVRVYTVNDPENMRQVYLNGCEGIITDVPDQALEVRKLVKE